MIATVVLADGSTERVVVPGSGRFDLKDDGELFILGTEPDGSEIGCRYLAPGTWRRASFAGVPPDRPFCSVSADPRP
jgi:hypothetical protein